MLSKSALYIWTYLKNLIFVLLFLTILTPLALARTVEVLFKKVKYLDRLSNPAMITTLIAGFISYPVIIALLIIN